VGHSQCSSASPLSPGNSRFPPRPCLRKGCGRQRSEVREERAAAARETRERKSRLKTVPPAPTEPVMPAEQPDPSVAWSRSRKIPGPICDRVGCYESPRPACRCPARYCSHECRDALQRVRDRERKWLWRNTFADQIKCQRQALRRKTARRASSADRHSADTGEVTVTGSDVVLPNRTPLHVSVSGVFARSGNPDQYRYDNPIPVKAKLSAALFRPTAEWISN
jgi:hypothetical protein